MDAQLPVMQHDTDADRQRIVREFLGGDSRPVCSLCGEDVLMRISCPPGERVRIEAECPGCAEAFVWSPPPVTGGWEPLHIAYFLERRRLDADLRCPYDDCRVVTVEYSDETVVFRCPFCNRQAAVRGGTGGTGLSLDTRGAAKI
jgi:hypothetical protein